MKDSILNEIVLSAAIARETSHRDPGNLTFLEDPEGTLFSYAVPLGPRQMIAGMT